jgi:hypothetical protein
MEKNNILMNEVLSLFVSFFYQPVYKKWRIEKKKAGKDIVGEEYENFRREYYKSKGFEIGNSSRVLGSTVNTDIVVVKNGSIVIVEEAKGSYVDSTFLTRAMIDSARIFKKCMDENKEPPLFILSCTTKMKNFDKVFEETLLIIDSSIRSVMINNFKYLPLCDNDRLNREKYFKSEENNFVLSEKLIFEQEEIINKVLNK